MAKPPSPETTFVRQHSGKSPKEIVEAAKKAGLTMDEAKVGKVRDYDRAQDRKKAKKGRVAPTPKTTGPKTRTAPVTKKTEAPTPRAPAARATKPAATKATPRKRAATPAPKAPKAAAPAASSPEANLERDLRAIAVELGLARAERILVELRARIANL